jgi:glucokinase
VAGLDVSLGFDLGGTKLAAALVDAQGRIVAERKLPGRVRDYDDALGAIAALADELLGEADRRGLHAVAAGVAVAALLDADRTQVVHAPILGWRDRPLLADLSDRLPVPVCIENDANAAAWGEHRHGAGAGERSLVVITLGTGVGGGVVIGDRLLTGAAGLAGELGHLKVGTEGRNCPCGSRDCLEQYAGGLALAAAGREAATRDPVVAGDLLALAAGDLDRIDGRLITAAARAGDPLATGILEQAGTWLGKGLAQVASVLDPGVILISGSLAQAGELVLAPARRAFAASVTLRSARPLTPIRPAALGNAAGVVGMAALAREHRVGRRPDPATVA